MSHQSIIEATNESIELLCNEFRSHPTLFFTENDIVCYFYRLLQEKLPVLKVKDKDDCGHFLIHTEYPTPFRCNMGNGTFKVVEDDIRTEKGGKYKRGHYDLIILNPDFIKHYSYEVLKAQNYELYKREVLSGNNSYGPTILYGIEFMFSRDPLKFSRGKDKEKGIDEFVKKVIQDADKLLASKNNMVGFMGQVKMFTFVKGSSEEICSLLTEKLSGRNEIILCFGD